MAKQQMDDRGEIEPKLPMSAQTPVSSPPSTTLTYVPESKGISRKVAVAIIAITILVLFVGIYSYKNKEIELIHTQHASELDSSQRVNQAIIEQKDKEIELIQMQHASELATREQVFEANLLRERDKGFWARSVQPWVDWVWGSEIEIEGETGPGRISGKVKITPDR